MILIRFKNRGMALVLTLTVCVFLLIFSITAFQQNSDVRSSVFKVKESIRAQFLAKGAAQMALLKIRELPTEFYDAVRWHKGWVDVNALSAEDKKDIKKFIPNISVTISGFTGVSNYLDFYIGFHTTDPNPFANVQLMGEIVPKSIDGVPATSPLAEADLRYVANTTGAEKDPFIGECMIKQLRLISQHNNNILDNVEIVAEGMEDSGNTYMMNNSMNFLKNVSFSQYNSVYRTMIDIGYMTVDK